MNYYDETIAAISTAIGEGGIGIIRISGDRSLEISNDIFDRAEKLKPRMMVYGHIIDKEKKEIIDEVMTVYFKAPFSYTAEDVVEIQCHGSVVSLRKILALILRKGARLAEPGEFTKRAFMNGRLDLTQAEAVIDLIKAKSDKTFDVAMEQLEGNYSRKIRDIRKKLVDVLVDLTVNIDYPDEDIEEITYDKLENSLSNIRGDIEKLLSTRGTGKILREGLNISIIGKPNVGKSSLMNALLKESRAIVTSIPGTTRDTIEEQLTIRNIPVRLTDTAGIRETDDLIEKIGIEKSKEAFNRADLVIFMIDCSSQLNDEDKNIMENIRDRRSIVVINKVDLEAKTDINEIRNMIPNAVVIEASLLNDTGVDLIEEEIEKLVFGGEVKQEESILVTNLRHAALLEESEASIRDALEMVRRGEALEFLEIDVNHAYELLGQIIGEAVEEDIINEVFSRFCLGK